MLSNNRLVKKVHASGYLPSQVKHPKQKPAVFEKSRTLNTSDTKKGDSRAFVKKDGMPVSFKPINAPRGKNLAVRARGLLNVK